MNIQQVPNFGPRKPKTFAILRPATIEIKKEAYTIGRLLAYKGKENTKYNPNHIKWRLGKLNALSNGENTGVRA